MYVLEIRPTHRVVLWSQQSTSSLHTFFCNVCIRPWCSCWCLLVYMLSHRPIHQGTSWRQQTSSSLHTLFCTVCIWLRCSCWCQCTCCHITAFTHYFATCVYGLGVLAGVSQCTCCHTAQYTKAHHGGNRVPLACIHSFAPCVYGLGVLAGVSQCTCCHTDQYTRAHHGGNRLPLACVHSFGASVRVVTQQLTCIPWCSCWCQSMYVLSHGPIHQGTSWR